MRKTHGVFIATPAKSHFKIAKYFLENNINVFIEKPITLGVKKKLQNFRKKFQIRIKKNINGRRFIFIQSCNKLYKKKNK